MKATQIPVNGVYLSGWHNLLWLNWCWNIDKAFPKNHIKYYLTKASSRKQTIKVLCCLAGIPDGKWKQRPPTHTLSSTRERQPDRQSHQEHFHLCCRQKRELGQICKCESKIFLSLTFLFKGSSQFCAVAHTGLIELMFFKKCLDREQYTLCVCVPVSLCVYEWVILEWPHPTWAVDLAGWECLASVSLHVPESTAHITGLFVPNVTPLKRREGIPSVGASRALCLCFYLSHYRHDWTWSTKYYWRRLSLGGNTHVVKLELMAWIFFLVSF